MALIKDKVKSIVNDFKVNPKDTGSSAVQVALLTERIQYLTNHLKESPKDFASRQGLFKMVGRRRRLLGYLKKTDQDRYQKIIQQLDLRK
jgi:small subunit ribosomal protein S15